LRLKAGVRLLVGVATAFITLSVTINVDVSSAAMRSNVGLYDGSVREAVDRLRKTDRLMLQPTPGQDAARHGREIKRQLRPAPKARSVAGCESTVSSLADSQLAKIAARCIS
jgi:hypothetical protein